MTFSSSSPVSLSSLGEVSISYLDWLAPGLSVSVHHLIHHFTTVGSSLVQQLAPLQQPSGGLPALEHLSASSLAALVLTVFAGALAVVAMSWRGPFSFWRRGPPVPPQVSDNDFSYLTSDDIVDPPRAHEQPQYIQRHHAGSIDPSDEEGPDILLLKHRGVTYPLHFPPYAIDDGALTVGEVRRRAAEKTRTSDPRRIKMLYKGRLLKDDAVPCKDEGLKQESEIMCVVTEVRPGESTSDLSGSDDDRLSETISHDSSDHYARHGKNKKNKKKKPKRNQRPAADPSSLAPPMDQRPSSSGRSSAAPSPAPSLQNLRTAQEQVEALAGYFRSSLVPLCEEYIAHPPEDLKARDFEHKRLSETILAQVILKADGIESGDARDARRALIKEAQAMLARLDQAAPEQNS
ncbi:hypothetical protein VTN77DRAFT_5803 [Rasamsonia byssochlamydoides]|uniref:uncharacterized protein n=1 Tax=Rasamsonia byssochlamydoides TaxID=89139 RepID=UPI003742AF8B